MKDCFVLYYDSNYISVEEVYDIFKRLENTPSIKDKTLIVLPETVNLCSYTKDELKQLLKYYKKNIEELFNE